MTPAVFVRQRLATLRERLAPDPATPARVWMRGRWLSLSALGLAIVGLLCFDAWLASCGFGGCPSTGEMSSFRPAEGGRILDRDGQLLGRLASVKRVNVSLEDVPGYVRQAFLATEDRRFYEHDGLDGRSVVRAMLRNASAGSVREGFSTITMQVARNTFVPKRYAGRSLRRKLLELRLAKLLERSLSKDQILALYLNVIYLGNGAYGVEAASRSFFGKRVRDLSLAEGALLAALPKGPSSYTPRRDPERARRRRNLVLALMVREGYLSQRRAALAAAEPIALSDATWRPDDGDDSFALDVVRSLVDSVLADAYRGGDLVVYTTLDAGAQRAATRAVRRRAAAIQAESEQWYGRRRDEIQGAMVALDPRSGDIRALVGGRHYERGGFNRALAARRQPGSAFKPFVYAAALTAGLSPATMVDDEPVEVIQGSTVWTPANYDDEYQGRVTMRRALMFSSNAATVRLSQAVGESRVVAVAHRNGITSPLNPVPALALGALEVTPVELVTAYAPFANGGVRVTPRLVRRIEAPDGTLLWSSEVSREPVMDPRDAFQLTSMLRSVVDHGTGRAIRDYGVSGPVAGKTGTTNNGTDVWFVGYTPTLVAGFWFGYDTPRSISGGAAGGRLAAPAWAEFYQTGWREPGEEGVWAPPPGMVMRVIDAETGELAGEWCPTTQREWFKPGTEPTIQCREHEGSFQLEEWTSTLGSKISRALRKVLRF
jgi:1A family penicillin-binding protein